MMEQAKSFDPRSIDFDLLPEILGYLFEVGSFENPSSENTRKHDLAIINDEYPALETARLELLQRLQAEEHGWSDDQIELLGKGFSMALLVMWGLSLDQDPPGRR